MASATNMTPAPAETPDLSRFSTLPPDVRQEIWRAASAHPSSVPGVCILTLLPKPPHSSNTTTGYIRPVHAPPVVHEPVNGTLLSVNTEAYDMAIQSTAGTRPYDPSTDILYISNSVFNHFTSDMCGAHGESWTSSIKHLALDLAASDRGLWLPIALERLASLETLSIVYPAATGTFTCFDTVKVPEDKHVVLRELTEEERKQVRITADHLYETHGGDIPVQWSKDADEHLRMVEKQLCETTDPFGYRGYRTVRIPIWDDEGKRLKLKYCARVFDRLKLTSYHNRE